MVLMYKINIDELLTHIPVGDYYGFLKAQLEALKLEEANYFAYVLQLLKNLEFI